MRSHAVVIVRIVLQNPTQMFLVQDNDVVQTLAPDRSDQPFGKAVLPRRGRCNWLVSDAHGTQSARDDSAVDSISISDHIARSAIPRKSLGDLPCNPLRRRVGCDSDPDEISAIKPMMTKPYSSLKPMVGITNKSMAAMSGACFRKKDTHFFLEGPPPFTNSLTTFTS